MTGASVLPTQSVDRERILLGPHPGGPDLGEVKGQALAKRAVLIAAAGHHNLLMLYHIESQRLSRPIKTNSYASLASSSLVPFRGIIGGLLSIVCGA
jgi:hypothetical protein